MTQNPLLQSDETNAYRLAVRARKRKEERDALIRFWDITIHPMALRMQGRREALEMLSGAA